MNNDFEAMKRSFLASKKAIKEEKIVNPGEAIDRA